MGVVVVVVVAVVQGFSPWEGVVEHQRVEAGVPDLQLPLDGLFMWVAAGQRDQHLGKASVFTYGTAQQPSHRADDHEQSPLPLLPPCHNAGRYGQEMVSRYKGKCSVCAAWHWEVLEHRETILYFVLLTTLGVFASDKHHRTSMMKQVMDSSYNVKKKKMCFNQRFINWMGEKKQKWFCPLRHPLVSIDGIAV